MSGAEMPMKGCVEQGVSFFENLAHKVSVIGYTIFIHLVYICLTVFIRKWETFATKSSSSVLRTVVLQCCMFVTQLLGWTEFGGSKVCMVWQCMHLDLRLENEGLLLHHHCVSVSDFNRTWLEHTGAAHAAWYHLKPIQSSWLGGSILSYYKLWFVDTSATMNLSETTLWSVLIPESCTLLILHSNSLQIISTFLTTVSLSKAYASQKWLIVLAH